MAQAVKQLWRVSQDGHLRAIAEAEQKQALMRESEMETVRVKGREEGREEGHKEVALRMLGRGMAPADVAALSGLSKKAVEGLRRKTRGIS